MAQCTATTRSGKQCRQPAIAGATVCRMHGGSAPQVRAAAERRQQQERAREAVAVLGLPIEIDPHDALLQEVYRSAGHVEQLALIVAQLEKGAIVRGVTKVVRAPGGDTIETRAALNVWVQLYQEERRHLLKACDTAINCGVAERQVELAERYASQIAQVVSAILTDLGHDLTEPKVRQTVRLRLIEGGKAAA